MLDRNLRPLCGDVPQTFGPVPPLRPYPMGRDFIPLCRNSTTMLLADGDNLYTLDTTVASLPLFRVKSPAGRPRAALFLSADSVLVSCTERTFVLSLTDYSVSPSPDDFPVPSITASTDSSPVVRVTMGGFSLSRNYTPADTRLDSSDVSSLASRLKVMYPQFAASARSFSRFLCPVLVRYRLLSSSGATLFLSSPQLITPSPVPFSEPFAMRISDGRTVEATSVDVQSYALRVDVGTASAVPQVAAMQIEVSREAEAVDLSLMPDVTIHRSSSDGSLSLLCGFPGMSGGASVQQTAIDRLRAENSFTVAERIPDPFSGEAKTVTVKLPPAFITVASPAEPFPGLHPGNFTATAFARCGATILALNPTFYPSGKSYPGYLLSLAVDSPLVALSLTPVSDVPLVAVEGAVGSSAGWDYVRARFHIFSSEGIFSVVTSGDSRVVSVAKVSAHPVGSRDAVALTPHGLFALSSGGHLLSVSGLKAKVIADIPAGSLLYDPIHCELIAVPDASPTEAYVFSATGSIMFIRTFPGRPFAMCNTPFGSWFSHSGSLWDCGRDSSPEFTSVEYSFAVGRTVPLSAKGNLASIPEFRPSPLLPLVVSIDSPEGTADVEVRACHGAGADNAALIFSRHIAGPFNSPFVFRFPAPALHLIVTVKASLPAGAIITKTA